MPDPEPYFPSTSSTTLAMSIQEIQEAIASLPRSEQSELFERLDEYRAEQWDAQIKEDAEAGRLDHLIAEAKADFREGRTRPL